MASEIRVNSIKNRSGLSTVTWNDEGLNVVGVVTAIGLSVSGNGTIEGNLGVAGTLTYEDVTRIDAVGLSTFREGLQIGPLAGIAATVYKDGSIRTSGVTTSTGGFVGALTGTASNASGATGDFSIADKIVHTGDTNTALRFPSADTFTVETAGSERLRILSNGRIGIGTDTAPRDMVHIHNSAANSSSYVQFTNANTNGTGSNDGTVIGISQNNSNTDGTGSGFTILQKENAEITLGTNNLERFRIEANGNIHLGDWSDQGTVYGKARLNIRGEDEIATSFALTGSYLHLGGQESTMNGLYPISFGHTKANSTKASSYIGAKVTDSASYEKTALVFATRDSTSDNDPTERMRIHHQGYVTKSTMPYGYVRYNTSGGEGDSSAHRCDNQSGTPVAKNGMSIDSNNRITVPYDGVYLFIAAINVAKNNGATHRPRVDLKKNGSYVTRKERQDLNGWQSFHVSHTLELSANDYLEIWVTGKCDSNDFQNASIVMLH